MYVCMHVWARACPEYLKIQTYNKDHRFISCMIKTKTNTVSRQTDEHQITLNMLVPQD